MAGLYSEPAIFIQDATDRLGRIAGIGGSEVYRCRESNGLIG